ncbi:MAG: hypothetical protein LH473_10360, partial [Chitinophagales bacterium]|nr:hypothetical protein [Chitinophagales bacterium]
TKLIVKLSQAQPAEIHERTKKKTASSENLDKELSAGYKSVAKESKKISRQFLTADLENWNEY